MVNKPALVARFDCSSDQAGSFKAGLCMCAVQT